MDVYTALLYVTLSIIILLPTSASEWMTHKLTDIIHMRLMSSKFTVFDGVYSYQYKNFTV